MRQFGPEPTGPIIERDGAYGVIVDANWRIAVVEVPKGVYLPGGGIEAGESAEEALRREVREETGMEIEIVSPMGTVRQYAFWRGDWYNKIGQYFLCRPISNEGVPTEDDHTLHWWSGTQAMADLIHESQRFMVGQALKPC